jgi:hypothetical protein
MSPNGQIKTLAGTKYIRIWSLSQSRALMLFSFYLETVANDKEDLERKTTQKWNRINNIKEREKNNTKVKEKNSEKERRKEKRDNSK